MPRAIAVLLACLGVLASPQLRSVTVAQEPAGPQFEQVQLTPDLVKRFLASFTEIKKVGKKYQTQSDQSDSSSSGPIGAVTAYLQNKQARIEIEKILQANGFSDFL
jgi:hypothetical protein